MSYREYCCDLCGETGTNPMWVARDLLNEVEYTFCCNKCFYSFWKPGK